MEAPWEAEAWGFLIGTSCRGTKQARGSRWGYYSPPSPHIHSLGAMTNIAGRDARRGGYVSKTLIHIQRFLNKFWEILIHCFFCSGRFNCQSPCGEILYTPAHEQLYSRCIHLGKKKCKLPFFITSLAIRQSFTNFTCISCT